MYVERGSYVTDNDPQLICNYTPSSQGLNPGNTSPAWHQQNMIIKSDPDTWLLGPAELIDPVLTCRSSHGRIRTPRLCLCDTVHTFVIFSLITPDNHVYNILKKKCTNPLKDLWIGSICKSSNQSQTQSIKSDKNIVVVVVVFSLGCQKVKSCMSRFFGLLLSLHNVILLKNPTL